MENVPEVIGLKNIDDFNKWILKLESLGYSTYIDILNAKDYGIPQSRRRCFAVSILGGFSYHFPKKKKLTKFLKDCLEKNVDDRYYLSSKKLNSIIAYDNPNFDRLARFEQTIKDPNKPCIAQTLTTREGHTATSTHIKGGYDSVNMAYPKSNTRRGRVGKGVSQTLTTQSQIGIFEFKGEKIAVRSLTEREMWRLMGFTDEDFNKAAKVTSKNQLTKQAGNSIVKDVLMAIFGELL